MTNVAPGFLRGASGIDATVPPGVRAAGSTAWKSDDGPTEAGVVTFHKISPSTTKVMLQLDFHPEGVVEKAGDKLGIVQRRVTGDLELFTAFIESRKVETGAWRGNVDA